MNGHEHSAEYPFWLTLGGRTSEHCYGSQELTIAISTMIGLLVISYGTIAWYWWSQKQRAANGGGYAALSDMVLVFVFCGLAHASRIVTTVLPFWSFQLLSYSLAAVFAVRFVWQMRGLEVIFDQATRLAQETDRRIHAEGKASSLAAILGSPMMQLSKDQMESLIHLQTNVQTMSGAAGETFKPKTEPSDRDRLAGLQLLKDVLEKRLANEEKQRAVSNEDSL